MIVSYTLCKHYKDLFKVFFFGVWAVVFEFNTKKMHIYMVASNWHFIIVSLTSCLIFLIWEEQLF